MYAFRTAASAALALLLWAGNPCPLVASSHREAPLITSEPKVDGTDFYMFRSYEPGREDFVTIVANYLPLQDPYGGPNYFSLDDSALYEIHIDSNGDGVEDITFQFQFQNRTKCLSLEIGEPGNTKSIPVPLIHLGPIGVTGDDPSDPAALNVVEEYTVSLVRGDRRTGVRVPIVAAGTGASTFTKPVDNIGTKSIPEYDDYASNFVYDIVLPSSPVAGRMFVGQRKDPFVVNLGETFDLVNLNPLGAEDGEKDDLADKNVTSLILELPIDFLLAPGGNPDPVIGGWTSASLRQARVLNPAPDARRGGAVQGGPFTQVSRLGMPLVNEVVIGLCDKDRFNASEPAGDAQFLDYVTHPTLPAIIEILFGVPAPTVFPRDDLVAAFLTGVSGLNQPEGVVPAEMLRLNTAIPPTPLCDQNRLGVIGGDVAGFPNGRRPGDDVVDIALRVAMGVLLPPEAAPGGQLPLTDGAMVDATSFDIAFPYLATPLPGSPSDFVAPPNEDCPPDPGTGVTRLVFRNLGPDDIGFRITAENRSIPGQPQTLPPGGVFTEQLDSALEDVNLFIFFPGSEEIDLGFMIDVPLNKKLTFERQSSFIQWCVTPLDGDCPPLPEDGGGE